ncbi:peptidase [Streptomyces sp. NPDC049541]|uniref:peptidase n=1 Tax=Streptomyces sp. NPDC049541 TaxID=3365594 RepID=UPI00379F8A82
MQLLAACGTTVVISAGMAIPSAHAAVGDRSAGQARLTLAQIAALPLAAQSRILDPLRALAAALDTAGKRTEPDTYATVRIDAPHDTVHVALTDPAQADKLIQAARKINPRIDTRRVTVDKAAYTLRQLHAARTQLLAQAAAHKLPYHVYSVAVATDGSSLQVGVDQPTQASIRTPMAPAATGQVQKNLLDGVTVAFQQGYQARPTDQAQVKWEDSSPQIGGDVLSDGHADCTAGIPAVKTSDNSPVMITANHCFTNGDEVFTEGGTHPAFGAYYTTPRNSVGNYVGTVTGTSPAWDAEELTGGKNNADVQLSDTWHPVTSDAYSYAGDLVCQSGGASYFMGYGNVCGIAVTNQDITWSSTDWSGTHNVRGVEGTRMQSNQPWAVAEGDSGALVYTVSGSTYQARGVNSAGVGPCCYSYNGSDVAFNYILWTEAPDILGHFGLKLNPTT